MAGHLEGQARKVHGLEPELGGLGRGREPREEGFHTVDRARQRLDGVSLELAIVEVLQGVLAEHRERRDRVLEIVNDERRQAMKRLELPASGCGFGEPCRHDRPGRLLPDGGQELEVLDGVSASRALGPDQHDTGERALPGERHRHRTVRNGIESGLRERVTVGIEENGTPLSGKVLQDGSIEDGFRRQLDRSRQPELVVARIGDVERPLGGADGGRDRREKLAAQLLDGEQGSHLFREGHPLLAIVVRAAVEVEADEAPGAPADVLGHEDGDEAERGDEDDQRAPEDFLRNVQPRQQPPERAQAEEVDAEDADDHRTIEQTARDRQLAIPQTGPHDRRRDRDVSGQQNGRARRQVSREEHLEEKRLAQEVEPGQEDRGEPEHEVLRPPQAVTCRRAQICLEPDQHTDGGEKLQDDPGQRGRAQSGGIERRFDVGDLEGRRQNLGERGGRRRDGDRDRHQAPEPLCGSAGDERCHEQDPRERYDQRRHLLQLEPEQPIARHLRPEKGEDDQALRRQRELPRHEGELQASAPTHEGGDGEHEAARGCGGKKQRL